MNTQKKQEQEDHGRSQAAAKYETLTEIVAALTVDYDRLEELKEEREELVAELGQSHDEIQNSPEDDLSTWDFTYYYELVGLIKQAGDCKSVEDAQEQIYEHPLSIEVRSDWESPGEILTPSQFCILLCTGGPAVRIVGELNEYGQPERACIEYQDWFTSWTEYHGPEVEQDTLLIYCQQFYFGE